MMGVLWFGSTVIYGAATAELAGLSHLGLAAFHVVHYHYLQCLGICYRRMEVGW